MTSPSHRTESLLNDYGQPIGLPVSDLSVSLPSADSMAGRYCRLEKLVIEEHGLALYDELCLRPNNDRLWTYMPFGPFARFGDFSSTLRDFEAWDDWFGFVILDQTDAPKGWAAYLRADLGARSIEVGGIVFSPSLQRTTSATESMYLMARHAFDSGFRRYEWKCDALNASSRRAAERLGFTYEGTFRQARIYKGRNRDTSWYSMIETEWPTIRTAFETWLDPNNFDDSGQQRRTLTELRDVSLHDLTDSTREGAN